MSKPMVFRGFNLQSEPYKVTFEEGLFNSPLKDIILYELARSDNAVAVYRRYKSREFTLGGHIKTDSSDSLEAAIDALKAALLLQSGELAVGWAGGTRYFEAECANLNINRRNTELDHSGWSAQFVMPVPFSTDGVTRDFITAVSGHTLATLQVGVNNIGTYLAYPFITLVITALEPNTSNVTFTFTNPATSENISITDEFADGDTITLDTLNKQIFRGSELLAGVGNFPAWQPGSGLLELSDTATSRTISLSATYIARYL